MKISVFPRFKKINVNDLALLISLMSVSLLNTVKKQANLNNEKGNYYSYYCKVENPKSRKILIGSARYWALGKHQRSHFVILHSSSHHFR